jgi:hypothetical protein
MLVISSARRGISLMDLRTAEAQWEKAPERGAPTPPIVKETGWSSTAKPRVRCSPGHSPMAAKSRAPKGGAGFSATSSVHGELGGAISNGGRFLFLGIN